MSCIGGNYSDVAGIMDKTNYSDVFKFSKVAQHIGHDKGLHGRKLGIMK
jgi:hypothetical protein